MKDRSWRFRMKWDRLTAESFCILGGQKGAPDFRDKNKYDIWTDKLMGMLPLIYSLIITWFYEEEKKEKVMLKYQLRFSKMILHPILDLVGGRLWLSVSINSGIRWTGNCSHSSSPFWILMHFHLVFDTLCLSTRLLQLRIASLDKILSC